MCVCVCACVWGGVGVWLLFFLSSFLMLIKKNSSFALTLKTITGPIMAASDKFHIDVLGKGGHGAAPHGTVDAIVEAAALVTSLQTVRN